MLKRIFKYLLLLSLTFLFSCRVEKRLYTGGYYISHPKEIKTSVKEKSKPAIIHTSLEISNTEINKEIASSNDSAHILIIEKKQEGLIDLVPSISKENNPIIQKKSEARKKEKPTKLIRHDEDKKVEKDVKSLLIAAIGVLFLSLLYVLFSTTQILLLVDVLFIVLPFSIIGLWIFALTLRPKYFYENKSYGKEKNEDPESDRIITKKKAFLLAGFLGIFGAHRFYLGYTQMGIFEMFTLGGFFVLFFIDLLKIKSGKLKPAKGEYDNDNSTYSKTRKKKAPNRSQRLIKLGVLVSLLALATMLGFAIFFAP